MTGALSAVRSWPGTASAGWLSAGTGQGRRDQIGPGELVLPWASVTKVLAAVAVWVAVEEGTVTWADPAGPPGSTLAHLLAHASGLAPDSDGVLAGPGRRRIYSNRGFELVAAHLEERSDLPFGQYLTEAVLEPLGMGGSRLDGSAASGGHGPLDDLMALAGELLTPTLVSPETLRTATSTAFPGLAGVLPGYGRQDPNDWGLGVEIRDGKSPHWTGPSNSPETFGHFGRSGSFLWVDPERGVAAVSLSDQPFGAWAVTAWPALAEDILAEVA